jgi:hypothetical protein
MKENIFNISNYQLQQIEWTKYNALTIVGIPYFNQFLVETHLTILDTTNAILCQQNSVMLCPKLLIVLG